MQNYSSNVVDPAGNAVAFATISIFNLDGTLATLFSNSTGTASLPNPFPADAFGRFNLFAANGTYKGTAAGSGIIGVSFQFQLYDPSDSNGAASVATSDGSTVQAKLNSQAASIAANASAISTNASNIASNTSNIAANTDAVNALHLADYAALRAYAGAQNSVYVTGYLASAAPSGIVGLFTRDDTDTTSADNGGTIIVSSNGKRWKRAASAAVNILWFGADASGLTGASSAIQAAINSLSATGGDVLVPQTAAFFLLDAMVSVPDGAAIRIRGEGANSKLKKGFNGDMVSLGKLGEMTSLYLDGNGSNYTGRGIIVTTGANDITSWRKIDSCYIINCASYCIEFTAAIAGFMSEVRSCILSCVNNATYAIKLPDSETNGNRIFFNIVAPSGALIDLGGSQNTYVAGCNSGAASANDAIKYSSSTIKARVIGNRFTGGNDITMLGTDCIFYGNICAMNMTIGASAAQCTAEGNNYSMTITDNSGQNNNLFRDSGFRSYTPTFSTSGGGAAIGNGSLNGNYTRKGREITAWIEFLPGSTTTFGSGGFLFSLPFAGNSGRTFTGSIQILSSGNAWFQGFATISGGASVVQAKYPNGGGVVNATTPATWKSGDSLVIQITYSM